MITLTQLELIVNTKHLVVVASTMANHVELMQQLFKKKKVDLSDNDEDDNSIRDLWEFEDRHMVELWSIALVPMIENVHFVMEFSPTLHALPISLD